MKITKQKLKQIIKEELSIVIEMSENENEEALYEKYWKAAVKDYHSGNSYLDEYYEDYDPRSENPLVISRVRYAYSHLRHALGHYGQPRTPDKKSIINAIHEGWSEGEYEYEMSREDY